jgi:hypothetical protein
MSLQYHTEGRAADVRAFAARPTVTKPESQTVNLDALR